MDAGLGKPNSVATRLQPLSRRAPYAKEACFAPSNVQNGMRAPPLPASSGFPLEFHG